MKIKCVDGTTFAVTWCGDTIHIEQRTENQSTGVEIPAEYVFDVINALRQCAEEHINANGEPPAQV